MRRTLLAAAAVLAVGAATALAQSGSDPYQLPEPPVSAGKVIRMPGAARCVKSKKVKVRLLPPLGAVFAVLRIDVRGMEAVRLTGVPRAASATVRLPAGRSRVSVAGTTLGGQEVRRARTYRTCTKRKRASRPRPGGVPLQQGGGED